MHHLDSVVAESRRPRLGFIDTLTAGHCPHASNDVVGASNTRPKLSLSTTPTASQQTLPALTFKSPLTPLRTTMSPLPSSPTAINTKLNQRGFSTMQHPTYAYVNHSGSRSILKKGHNIGLMAQRRLQFIEQPIVHPVTPIDDEEYYGGYRKMSREERRWQVKSWTACQEGGETS